MYDDILNCIMSPNTEPFPIAHKICDVARGMNSDCILNATQLIISQSDILINICFVNDPSLNDGERWINRTIFMLPTTLINVGIKATNLPGSNDMSKKDDMIHSIDGASIHFDR